MLTNAMPQLSTDTNPDGSSISERDLERAERLKPGPDSPQALHEINAKPVYDSLRKVGESGIEYTVTSRYRPPESSTAHADNAVDVKAKDPAKNFELAAQVSQDLGKGYFVQVEEALPNGQQKNTVYSGGKVVGAKIIARTSGFTGTHVHIQKEKSARAEPTGRSRRGDRG